MLKNYDFDSLEICFSGIDHHLAPDCCHRNLTENRIWLCITNFLNKQSKSLRTKKSKNSSAAAPLKNISWKKNALSLTKKTLILWFWWWCFLLKENPTTKLKNELLSLKKDFSQTKHNTKKHWNLKNNRQNLTSNLRLKT